MVKQTYLNVSKQTIAALLEICREIKRKSKASETSPRDSFSRACRMNRTDSVHVPRAVTNGGAKSWSRGQPQPPVDSLKRRRVYRCFRFRYRSWSEALPSPSSHRYSTSATCPYCVSACEKRTGG